MENKFAYVGTKPCGCTVAATVINPEWAKDTAKSVAQWIKDGYTVDKVSLEEVKIKLKSCKCAAEAAAKQRESVDLPLFAV